MKPTTWRDYLWPLSIAVLFFLLPVGYETTQRLYVGSDTRRAFLIVVLNAGLLLGTASAGFFVLGSLSRFRRRGRPTTILALRRELNLFTLAFAFLAGTIAISLVVYSVVLAAAYVVSFGLYLAFSLAPSRRLLEYRAAITARCSPESAFAFLSDAGNWPLMQPRVEVLQPYDLPLRIGSVVRERVTIGRNVLTGADEVVLVEPYRRFGTRTRDAHGDNGDLYEFIALPGGTEIRFHHSSEISTFPAIFGGVFLRNATQQRMLELRQESLSRMRDLLERGSAASV